MFESARIKLTLWYLLIIMSVSLLFSISIYSRINADLSRFEQMQTRYQRDVDQGIIREFPNSNSASPRLNVGEIQEARARLILTLGIINLLILGFAGTAGYFLAGRTLRPISEMVEEQNRFISDSSHELRTPLTSLRSEIEVGLRNKTLSLPNARKILASNLEEVVALQVLSDDLLELSQNGNLVNKNFMKKVSISEITKIAVKKVDSLAKNKSIIIENKVKNGTILGVQDRLTEVIVILLDNAVKYSPRLSMVEISSKISEGKVLVSVIDHGRGIDEKDLPHIFDRFYRADKSRTESGYGLGLSIARKIVESHGGAIKGTSIPGRETVFTITLPA